MKVSLSAAQQYSNVDLKKLSKDELLDKIGAQLGAVEEVVEWGPRYEGILVVKVVECIKHPDADKLHVCKIDDGGVNKAVERDAKGLVQVVCGAPNVREGMLVAWIPPEATVPSTIDKDPFVLEAKELRGVVSNGMLASATELSISDDHSGLLEVKVEEVGPELAKPGTEFSKLYGVDDLVIDLENKMFTHRPDCFGVMGVARELAGIQVLRFKSPDWYTQIPKLANSSQNELPVEVKVEDSKLTPRFMAVSIKDVKVEPSDIRRQAELSRLGIKPINNIVDITNWVMQITGQPLHAYDYDKVAALSSGAPKLIARRAKDGETIKLLGGKEAKLTKDNIVIATDKKVIGIAGVMGGAETEVDEGTKNIILECANFDMYSIRRTSMKLGLFTDAVTRFIKGQSPQQTDRVLAYALDIIKGTQASEIVDIKTKLENPKPVEVSSDFINARLGSKLKASQMSELLENVEFEVDVKGETLKVTPPFWRMDIHLSEDIVEEVGRLYGFDKLPVELPKRVIKPVALDPTITLKNRIRNILSAAGANEVLTYSFVRMKLLDNVGQDSNKAYQLSNAISPDLQYYRLSLTPSLLDKVHANIKSDYIRNDDNEFALFEINKTHNKDFVGKDKLPTEAEKLAFVFAADDKTAKRKYEGAPYYAAVSYVRTLFAGLNLSISKAWSENAQEYFSKNDIPEYAKPYELSRSSVLLVNDSQQLGIVGEYKNSARTALKLPKFCAGFELDLGELEKYTGNSSYAPIGKFPKITQDVSYKVSSDISIQEFYETFQSSISEILKTGQRYFINYEMIDLYQGDDKTSKTITMRVCFFDYERTLTTQEINKFIEELSMKLSNSIKAERV